MALAKRETLNTIQTFDSFYSALSKQSGLSLKRLITAHNLIMSNSSLLETGNYSLDWVKPFYDQAAIWWGIDDGWEMHAIRANTVQRLASEAGLRVLDLGSGGGRTAAAMADLGFDVTGVEIAQYQIAQEFVEAKRIGKLKIIAGDYYTVQLDGKFDVVTWWHGFGMGTDDDQRKMLNRIADDWLTPTGCALIDIYNPAKAARETGKELRLPPLPNVPGSVEMINRSHYDAVNNRWIDEWEPVANPENRLAQTMRCYSPSDLQLLLRGTGLAIKHLEVEGHSIEYSTQRINLAHTLLDSWSYLVQLITTR